MPETGTPYEFPSAREYLEFLMGVYGIKRSKMNEKIKEVLSIFNLKDDKKHIQTYSKGMKQKVLFLGAIIHNPKLLILDEPFNAIEPQTAMLMKNVLHQLKKGGSCIIFSSHILEIVEKLAEKGFSLGINLIETFPTLVKKICKAGSFSMNAACQTENQKSALICAQIAFLHSQFKTRWLDYKDGFLFLPEMSFWKKDWKEKFYQAWKSRPYLKYRRLITNLWK